VLVTLPEGADAEGIAADALALGVEVEPLAGYVADRDGAPPGLVLGYATLTPAQIDEGIKRLAAAAL
jgi:GntR family transcriptional regulator / MocR family aminotransferase